MLYWISYSRSTLTWASVATFPTFFALSSHVLSAFRVILVKISASGFVSDDGATSRSALLPHSWRSPCSLAPQLYYCVASPPRDQGQKVAPVVDAAVINLSESLEVVYDVAEWYEEAFEAVKDAMQLFLAESSMTSMQQQALILWKNWDGLTPFSLLYFSTERWEQPCVILVTSWWCEDWVLCFLTLIFCRHSTTKLLRLTFQVFTHRLCLLPALLLRVGSLRRDLLQIWRRNK